MTVVEDLVPDGVLIAAINLGNPVLAQGTGEDPRGITVDLARDLADRLGVRLRLHPVDAARDAVAAVRDGVAGVAFLAIDPAREAELAFTPPYVVIEGVFAVPPGSPIADASRVDRAGIRVGVKAGSAYDLHLTRALRSAQVIRSAESTDDEGLEVVAGIRRPLTAWADGGGWRVLEPAFMAIRQAVAVRRGHSPAALAALGDWIEARKADGFVAASLARAGRDDALVAPPTP